MYMKILVVEPGKHPYEKEIEGTLKEMQKIVGGRIQALYPFRDEVGVVCNDDGISLQMPFNRKIDEECYIFGTFFLCGLGLEDFTSLPENLMEKYRKRFYSPQFYTASGVYNLPPERYRLLMVKLGELEGRT